jgi:hypothetical protein
LVVCTLVAASILALAGCGGSARHSVTRSEFVNAIRISGLGPIRILDNGAQLAKLARSLRQPDLAGGAANETLAISAHARDPLSARLYAVRLSDSSGAKTAAAYGGVRVCNVVLRSAALRGTAERRRFGRLVATLRERC